MSDIIHEVLSELHHLLSIASADELRSAGNLPSTSPHIRTALEALADEKVATSKRVRSMPGAGDKALGEKSKRAPSVRPGSNASVPGRGVFRSLEAFSKEEIVELARSFGVEIPVDRKDARSRIVRRLESAVEALPEEERQRIVSGLAGGIDRQTAGWVDVIKKGK